MKKIIDWLKRWHDVHVLKKVGDEDDDGDACMIV